MNRRVDTLQKKRKKGQLARRNDKTEEGRQVETVELCCTYLKEQVSEASGGIGVLFKQLFHFLHMQSHSLVV